ncbi:hypothetical protein [Nocardioides lijunqiniae]|nr:hypothetical protein [Nocardioides lijunqiniae]
MNYLYLAALALIIAAVANFFVGDPTIAIALLVTGFVFLGAGTYLRSKAE